MIGNLIVLIVANALNYFRIDLMADLIGWIGIAVIVGGVTLRVWASQTLGRFYMRTLLIRSAARSEEEMLVTSFG